MRNSGRTRYCHRENDEFSVIEFEFDPEWGWIHRVDPIHTEFATLIDEPMIFEELGGM